MKNNPEVCIITLNWNGKSFLKKCLDSIQKWTKNVNYRLILVDNGSTDKSQSFIKKKYKWVDLLELKENTGFSGGNNIGIEYAFKKYNPDYYYLLSNDTWVEKNWLKNILDFAKQTKKGGMFGSKQFNFKGELANYAGNMTKFGRYKHIFPTKPTKVRWISGAGFLVKKELIKKIGALDETFNPAYYEESDWEERANKAGFEIYSVPNSRFHHKESGSEPSYTFNKYVLYYKNRFIFYHHHYRRLLFLRFILDLLKGIKTKRLKSIIKGYTQGVKIILKKRDKLKTIFLN